MVTATLALGAAAGLLLLLRSDPDDDGPGRPKGARAPTVIPLVAELTCAGAHRAACPAGSRLSIAVTGGREGGYLGAFAEPAGGGTRVWYFSAEDGVATLSDSAGETRLASRSIVLGPEHPAGRYRVHVVLSDRPLSRREILDPQTTGTLSRTALPLEVVASAAPARSGEIP